MTKSTPINANIAVLSGDGIGPEVMNQAILCLDKVYVLYIYIYIYVLILVYHSDPCILDYNYDA